MNDVQVSDGTSMGPDSGWTEAIAASAAAVVDQDDVSTETVTDSIDVPMNEVQIGARLIVVQSQIDACKTAVDGAKAAFKARKGDLEEVEGERDELITALKTGVLTIDGTFRVVTNFRTLTEEWFDAGTGLFLKKVPMDQKRRQTNLPFAASGEADEDFDEDKDGDGEDDFDDTTGFEGSQPDLDAALAQPGIDAEVVLDAAANGAAPEMSKPPSKPINRKKKAQ